LAGALVFFALGIVGWLVPVVTGLPFYVAGLLLLGMSSDRVLGLINRADRKLPMGVRRALRHALGKVPNRRLRSRARRPDDADG
jgi:uncharacterized membrane protein YbaN (DUF454 family)